MQRIIKKRLVTDRAGEGIVFSNIMSGTRLFLRQKREKQRFFKKKRGFFSKILLAMNFFTVEPQKNLLYIIAE